MDSFESFGDTEVGSFESLGDTEVRSTDVPFGYIEVRSAVSEIRRSSFLTDLIISSSLFTSLLFPSLSFNFS